MLFSEFIMERSTYFTAASLKITSINQNNLGGNNTLSCISNETDHKIYFLELIHSS